MSARTQPTRSLTQMIIFNGSNISDESTPKPIKFLPKLSLVRCCVEINQ